jgi:hypothetical protein
VGVEELILAGEEDSEPEEALDTGLDSGLEDSPRGVGDLDRLVRGVGGYMGGLNPLEFPDLPTDEQEDWNDYRIWLLREIIARKTDREIQENCAILGVYVPSKDELRAIRLSKRVREWLDFDEVALVQQGMASWYRRVEALAVHAESLGRLKDLLDPMNALQRPSKEDVELLRVYLERRAGPKEESDEVKTARVKQRVNTADDPFIAVSKEWRDTLKQLDDMQGRRHANRIAEANLRASQKTQSEAQKALASGRGAVVILPAADPDPFGERIAIED